jgi:hypothetical protein
VAKPLSARVAAATARAEGDGRSNSQAGIGGCVGCLNMLGQFIRDARFAERVDARDVDEDGKFTKKKNKFTPRLGVQPKLS